MMKNNFQPGDKVVCAMAPWLPYLSDTKGHPVPWQVLTVKETYNTDNLQLLWFSNCDKAESYSANCFRPFHDETSNRIIEQVGSYPKNLR